MLGIESIVHLRRYQMYALSQAVVIKVVMLTVVIKKKKEIIIVRRPDRRKGYSHYDIWAMTLMGLVSVKASASCPR